MKNRSPYHFSSSSGKSPEKDTLTQDLEGLLQRVILEEVSSKVWKQFEEALLQLDKQSLDLLERHLDGVPSAKLGEERNLTEAQVKELLNQLKKDLIRHLRRDNYVKQ